MRCEKGMSGSVQFVVLLPVTLAIFLGLLQWSLNYWAEASALAAAQQGAAVASLADGTAASGHEAAVRAASNGSLTDVEVRITRGGRETRATVAGRVLTVLWPGEISHTAVVATERLTSP